MGEQTEERTQDAGEEKKDHHEGRKSQAQSYETQPEVRQMSSLKAEHHLKEQKQQQQQQQQNCHLPVERPA